MPQSRTPRLIENGRRLPRTAAQGSRFLLGLVAALPLLTGSTLAVAASSPAPAPGPKKTPLNTLAEPTALISGALDPAALDPDADGVPTSADNCPFLPNPSLNGKQPAVCGQGFSARGKGYAFLKSRVFVPALGVDKNLNSLDPTLPAHVILHLKGNGALLPDARRVKLEQLGVKFAGYLPDDAFYVSLLPAAANLTAILGVDGVVAITARLPADRVDPALRLRGPAVPAADKSFMVEVEFFGDVPKRAIEAALAPIALSFELLFDTTYGVRVASWPALEQLASLDGVKWIDEPDDDELDDFTLNAQTAIGAEPVRENFGYRGDGVTVALTELSPLYLNPENPDMRGRLTIGNTPTFPFPADQHAWSVASIMIADETSFPDNMGLLPDAELVSFALDHIQTRKRRYYGLAKDAREDHGALVMNNSWGKYKCGKIGEYTGHAKWRDRSIFDLGVIVVDAAGNGRDVSGYGNEGCPVDEFSLAMVTAKNPIMVGNWSLFTDSLSDGSSIGPSADGRLKPDLVAPGDGVNTLGFKTTALVDVSGVPAGGLEAPQFVGETFPVIFGGTSGAAPVTSGVVGWMGQAFVDQGQALLDIPPSRVKAILLHTARDVGLPGPDFEHGYGLLQAGAALRITQEWSLWGHEHVFQDEGEVHDVSFDVTTPVYTYKATLAWDDVEGEDTSDKALKNDLDLTLESPTGVLYRPFDLRHPLGSGATPAPACTGDPCDDRNNVEQVVVRSGNGLPLELGTWKARVTVRRLVSAEQRMSLVLTPPCPVVIDHDVTLTGSIDCTPHPLQPVAVEMPASGVTLDCDGFEIAGAFGDAAATRNYVGVNVSADSVTVRNCNLSRFDVGIRVGTEEAPVTDALLASNQLYDMRRRAIALWGDDNAVSLNWIQDMQPTASEGIHVRGDRNFLAGNQLNTSEQGPAPVGIYVGKGSTLDVVSANFISGTWEPAIQFESDDELEPVSQSHAALNIMHEIIGVGVALTGAVDDSTVDANVVRYYGASSPGILVEASAGLKPNENSVLGNSVLGSQHATQTGVRASATQWTKIIGNLAFDVGTGVHDEDSDSSWIKSNFMSSLDTTTPYRGAVGVLRQGGTVTQITNNFVRNYFAGVSVVNSGAEQLLVTSNDLDVAGIGISVIGGDGAEIVGNAPVVAGISGIALFGGDGASISLNGVSGFLNTGIYAFAASDLVAENNTITDTLTNPGADPPVGLHYAKGESAALLGNTITSQSEGIGIQLGLNPLAPCTTVNVEDVELASNTYVNVGTELLAGCDVGAYTNTP